jgi:hypothetical protein
VSAGAWADLTFSTAKNLNSTSGITTLSDVDPVIATDGNGKYMAVWHGEDSSNNGNGTDADIYFSTSSDAGATWSAADTLNSNAATDASIDDDVSVDIATDGDGTWIAVWRSTDNVGGTSTDRDIFFAVSTDFGANWTTPAHVHDSATSDGTSEDRLPRIASDGNDSWIVVWASSFNLGGTIGTDRDIFYVVSTNDGTSWSSTASLNSTADSDSGDDNGVEIATDGAGNFIAVWQSLDNLGSTVGNDSDIFYSVSSNTGTSWSNVATLNSNAATDSGSGDVDRQPAIATDGAGTWMTVWSSDDDFGGTGHPEYDIFFSVSTNNGTAWSTMAPVNSNATTDDAGSGTPGTGDDDQQPHVAVNAAGDWTVVWHSDVDLGTTHGVDNDIFLACSDDDGATWSTIAKANSDAEADAADDEDLDPRVVAGAGDDWLLVWESDADGDNDIRTASVAFPVVNSITRADTNPTNADSVDFTVVFSQSVTGVDTTDFDAVGTLDVVGNVASVVDSGVTTGVTYTVTVDTISGNGTLRLDVDDDDSIEDALSNPLGGIGADNGDFTTGESYTIDNDVPDVASIARLDANPTAASSVDFLVTFDEGVLNSTVDTTDFDLTTTLSAVGNVASVTPSGVTTSATFTVTVDTISGDGTVRLDFDDDDSVTDEATNPTGGTGAGNGDFTAGEAYTINASPPEVQSITVDGDNPTNADSVSFTATFTEDVSGVDTTDFDLTKTGDADGDIDSVSLVTKAVDGDTYTVTVINVTGNGSLVLDVVDDDSILDDNAVPLGGTGVNNGDFTDGQILNIDNTPPTVDASGPSSSLTSSGPVMYTLTYGGESAVTLAVGDIALVPTGDADADIAIGGAKAPTQRTVILSNITGDGTLSIMVAAGTASDNAGNLSPAIVATTAFTVDNTAPSISFGTPSPLLTQGGPVSIAALYSDDSTDITLSEDDLNVTMSPGVTADVEVLETKLIDRNVRFTNITGDGTISFSIASGTATDDAGNEAGASGSSPSFTVDNTAPVITRVGDETVEIEVDAVYDDEGATANDNNDGDITDDIVTDNPVDTSTPGTYTVSYDVTDEVGNEAETVTRTVIVDSADTDVSEMIDENGGTVSRPGLGLTIPPGALDEETEITLVRIDPDDESLPRGLRLASGDRVFEILGLESLLPGSDFDVVLDYPDEDQDGIVDDTTIEEADLELILFNPNTGENVTLGGVLDTVANTFSATISQAQLNLVTKGVDRFIIFLGSETTLDVDGSGSANIIDLQFIINEILQFPVDPSFETDVSGDGVTNIVDVNDWVQRFLVSKNHVI